MNDLTVCIKTFLRDHHLIATVESVRTHLPDAKIIVADDGRRASRKTRAMQKFEVDYHLLPFDVGLSFGRNFMLDRVETEYALILDDDMLLTPDTHVADMLTLLGRFDLVGGALMDRGQMINYEGTFAVVGKELRMKRTVSHAFSEYKGVRFQKAHFVLNLLAARAQTLRDLRWDDRFRIAYEHIDLFMRAKDARLKVAYAPDSVFQHTRSQFQPSPEYRTHRQRKESRPIFFEKWNINRVRNLQGHIETIQGVRQVVTKERQAMR